MSLCASCGLAITSDTPLCLHHHNYGESGWAATNRIMCDWLHRGVELPRLPKSERDDMLSFWDPVSASCPPEQHADVTQERAA